MLFVMSKLIINYVPVTFCTIFCCRREMGIFKLLEIKRNTRTDAKKFKNNCI